MESTEGNRRQDPFGATDKHELINGKVRVGRAVFTAENKPDVVLIHHSNRRVLSQDLFQWQRSVGTININNRAVGIDTKQEPVQSLSSVATPVA